MQRVVVISGGSSGIGKALADLYIEQGDQVYELSRSGTDRPGLTHLTVDLRKETQIAAAMERIGQESGRIDLLLNNAGMGISGALERTESDQARLLFDVDFFAVYLCCKYALPGYANPQMVGSSTPAPSLLYSVSHTRAFTQRQRRR